MKQILLCYAFAIVLSASAAFAEDEAATRRPTFALSLDAGTTGIGGSLWFTASERVTISLGYAALDIDQEYSTDEADYDGTADFANGHALLNWHPFKGLFHLSLGAILADDTFNSTAMPAAGTTYEFDGVTYSASDVGNLTADVEIADGVVPYLGLGWSSRPTKQGFGFFVDLGVMFSGSVQTTLTADGPLASDPTFQANLEQERQDLQDELDEYKVFPVLRAGVMYRF